MMVVTVRLHDNSKNQSVVLSNQDTTVIGRGFFECQDKRVSKRHGEITVIDATIKIKSCHQNPIFYTLKNESGKKVLRKDSEIILGDSDKFSLLPDEYEWTVKIEQESDSTSTFRVRQTEEINANLTQLLRDGNETPDLERTPSPENLRPPVSFENDAQTVSTTSRKRSIDTEESSDAKKMRINIKPDPDSSEASSSVPAANLPSVSSIKTEPEDNPNQPTSSTTGTTNESELPNAEQNPVKIEPNDDSSSCQRTSNLRPSCEFGIRCYRLTDEHRREYAHPMDDDYRRPNFPQASQGAPRCPYWDACYRRNPEHFREMAHPSSDQYVTQRPPQIQISIQHVVRPQVNQPSRVRNQNRRTNADEDDDLDVYESEEDIFNDGDDSDLDEDFIVMDDQSISEEDFEDEENNLEE